MSLRKLQKIYNPNIYTVAGVVFSMSRELRTINQQNKPALWAGHDLGQLKRAALDHFELDSMSNMAIDAKIYEQNMKETRNTYANLLIPSRECGILSMR